MRRAKWALLIFVFIGLIFFAFPEPAHAGGVPCPPRSSASGYVVVEARDANITILENGDVRYDETWIVNFEGTDFRFAYRTIPLNRATDITQWGVSEGGIVYSQASSGQNVFKTSGSSSERTIHWCFPSTSYQTRTFKLSYTVEGSLEINDELDRYFWKFIESDRGYSIARSTVRLNLPANVASADLILAAFLNGRDDLRVLAPGELAEPGRTNARVLDSRTIEFAGGPFADGVEWEIGLDFPHGIVRAEKPMWQTLEQSRPLFDFFALAMSLLLTIGGGAGAYLFWYTRGRDQPIGIRAEFYPKPPAAIPPGIVGVLLDEMADIEDIMATLIDLARRGYLTITETKKSGFGLKADFSFSKTDKPQSNLRPYEAKLISAVFGRSKTRELKDLTNKFYRSLPGIRDKMYEEVTQYGFFQGNPEHIRRNYGCVGIAFLIIFGLLSFGLFNLVGEGSSVLSPGFAFCLSASLFVFPVAFLIVARVMPRKTDKGSRAAMQWNAFRNYLKNIEKYQEVEKATDQFEKYLPYAIAFGLEKSWVRKFERTQAPVPMWYDPFPGHSPIDGGSGKVRGRPISQGGEAPSLDSAAGNIFGGLESMSTGLFTMLDQASSTFTSAPSSSGGGGGGGFSGGGGGGGGSSGFG